MAKKKKKQKSKARRIVGKSIKYFILTVLAVLAIMICTGLGLFYGAVKSTQSLSDVSGLVIVTPSVILDDEGNELIQLSAQGARRTDAEKDEIPETLKWAFIDLEDERFYEHNGIDYKGLLRSIYVNLTSGRREGASTITQQLLKNTVFETGGRERSDAATVKRKIQEWVLALELEKEMDKEDILLSYLNNVLLGSGYYGVKEGAKYYFNKELSELTPSECAVLASIVQNPSANNPARGQEYQEKNWKRASVCLANMLENGHITQEEYDTAINDNVYSRVVAVNRNAGESVYTYYIDNVVRQVLEDLQEDAGYSYAQAYNAVYTGGLTIYSNQNVRAQEIIDTEINNEENYEDVDLSYSINWNLSVQHSDGSMEYFDKYDIVDYFEDVEGYEDYKLDYDTTEEADEAVAQYKEYLLKSSDNITYEDIQYTLQPQASFSLIDYTTGKVLAICGGRGEKETSLSLDRAAGTNARRQPGSTFKIVAAFAPALDMGVATLATAYDDAPLTYSDSGKSIANWWGNSYRGLNTIRQGIIDSMNIVACKTMYYMGASNALPYLRSFGYDGIVDGDANMATAIGGITNGVTNLENCAAFGAIANDGVYNEPMFYSKVVDANGKVILDSEVIQDTHRVIDESTASLLTSAMRQVVTRGTGTRCAIDSAPLAGKTGTTNDYNDLWFAGYVPNGLCATIWVGYDENLPIASNPNVQKRFYANIMEQLVVELGAEGGEFTMKGNIVQATVCSKSGRLPNEHCNDDPAGSTLYTEYFRADTVPGSSCDVHYTATICKETGKLATEFCPETEEQVFRRRPLSIDGTAAKGETPDSEYEAPEDECDKHTEEQTSTEEETTTKADDPDETTEETTTNAPPDDDEEDDED